MIEIRGLWKRFGDLLALEPLNLTIHAGEVVALVGPNGAGKSTALRILAGILTPEQMQKYNAMSEGRAVRPATIYVLNAKGQPEARTIRVGLADDITTEVVSGLNDGDMVIVRSRTAQR